MNNIDCFKIKKNKNEPITMLTCYDYWTAKILANTNVDSILVGDSVAMVMHGENSTIHAHIEMIATHIQAVRKGIGDKFIIGDLPFMSYHKSISKTMSSVELLMKAGANAIKLEGVEGHEKTITQILNSGVPVMGHLGFTPQSINIIGKSYVKGKSTNEANKLIEDAKKLEDLGCFAIVLECVSADLAEKITNQLSMPTIGIGAGVKTSGQILVLQDLLGGDPNFHPKFLKKYLDLSQLIKDAVNQYCHEVEELIFPAKENSYF